MTYKDKKIKKLLNSVEGYDLYAPFYDKKKDFLDSFEKEEFFKMLPTLKGKKILDLGCGTGRLIWRLKDRGAKITGVDISKEMLNIARKKYPDIEFVECDAQKLPFKDNSFDTVFAMFLIVHFHDLEKVFSEVYRVLKDNGQFILSNINQKKAPKLKIGDREEIVIKSFYHMPEHVEKALKNEFFNIEKNEYVYEEGVWINQLIRCRK